MHHKTLQTRFFISYLGLVLAIVTVLSVFFYQYTSGILIERETESIVSLTSHLQVQTDQAVKAMDNVSIDIGYSNLIMDNLEAYFAQTEPERDQTNRLADLFVALNGTDTQVDQINIYNFSGEVVGFGRSNISLQTQLADLPWYGPTIDRQGRKYLSRPYSTATLSKTTKVSTYYLSLYRTYYNRFGKQVGIVETMQTCNTIFRALIALEKKDPAAPDLYVFNADNQVIYPFKTEDQAGLTVSEQYLTQLGPTADHILARNPQTAERELVACQRSAYTGWTYLTVQPEKVVLAPVRQLTLLLLGVIFVLLVAASLLSLTMSVSLARPIRELRNIMCRTELETLGDQPQLPLAGGFEEVEELNQAFSTLSGKLKKSMDQALYAKNQEMKARNVALQSQINPHFYYNSLASIIILAENGLNSEVVKLCRSLNSIMRYITRGRSPLVTLKEELDYLGQYLYCMKIRYQNSLQYSIEINPSMMDESIPKLLIQPLVENALKYGTNCYPPWQLAVTGQRIESGWIIEVTDKGPGFPDAALERLQAQQQQIDETDALLDSELDGMGLVNVYARWKLHAGPAGLFICSNRASGGASVLIGQIGDPIVRQTYRLGRQPAVAGRTAASAAEPTADGWPATPAASPTAASSPARTDESVARDRPAETGG